LHEFIFLYHKELAIFSKARGNRDDRGFLGVPLRRAGEDMEKTLDLVEWDNRYALGIPLIDGQHKKLVEMTNRLYQSCLQGDESAKKQFRLIVHEAVDYVRYHFATEEKILILIDYPDFEAHKKQHELFILEILQKAKAFEEGKKLVPTLFVQYLRNWILGHIAVSDKLYADYLKILKKQGKLEGYMNKTKRKIAQTGGLPQAV
jgi:hemerythrin